MWKSIAENGHQLVKYASFILTFIKIRLPMLCLSWKDLNSKNLVAGMSTSEWQRGRSCRTASRTGFSSLAASTSSSCPSSCSGRFCTASSIMLVRMKKIRRNKKVIESQTEMLGRCGLEEKCSYYSVLNKLSYNKWKFNKFRPLWKFL